MSNLFPEPLEQYWYYEVIKDKDFQVLLIASDIQHVLEACGYSEELAIHKALEIFFILVGYNGEDKLEKKERK